MKRFNISLEEKKYFEEKVLLNVKVTFLLPIFKFNTMKLFLVIFLSLQ